MYLDSGDNHIKHLQSSIPAFVLKNIAQGCIWIQLTLEHFKLCPISLYVKMLS